MRFRILLFLTCCALVLAGPMLAARSWQEIRRSGELVVLTAEPLPGEEDPANGLHRIIMPIDRERAILAGFAEENRLTVKYVRITDFASLFPMLEAGQGDLISSNLAATPQRAAKFRLSVPYAWTSEMLFASAKSRWKAASLKALAGKRGALLPGTTYAENFRAAAAGIPALRAGVLSATISHDELIELVASGRIDYSVLNECDLNAHLAYRKDVRKLFPIRRNVPLVFAALKEEKEMMALLDGFIRKSVQKKTSVSKDPASAPVPEDSDDLFSGDLDAIRRRGFLRVLTTNELYCCFLQKGQLCGFEYEWVKRFADQHHLKLLTVIPEKFDDLPRYLEEGRGDLIAANVTRTPERVARFPHFTFCAPYGGVSQVLVGRRGEKIIRPKALAGRRVHVRRSSPGYAALEQFRKEGIDVTILTTDDSDSLFQMLQKVSDGRYELTVADDTYLQSGINCGMKIKGQLVLTPKQPFAWVVRKSNPQLAAAVGAFIQKEHRGTFYNLCYRRYYGVKEAKKRYSAAKRSGPVTVSPYDAVFRKYGSLYHFNWYLLAAQAYQESRFDAKKVNHIGAAGLMQVMPATAREMGVVGSLTNPDTGVMAGTLYLAQQRRRFDSREIAPLDQLCFALASYNAGYGHVADARRLAAKKGWNPNVWFGHTEKALALLEEPGCALHAKYGYCRASETIPYVRNVILGAANYEKMMKLEKERRK